PPLSPLLPYTPLFRSIAHDCPRPIVRTLLQNFELGESAVYYIDGPVNLNRVIQVHELVQRPELKYPPFTPRNRLEGENVFEALGDRKSTRLNSSHVKI